MSTPMFYTGERPEILRLIRDSDRRILDIGCSTGDLGEAIKQQYSSAIVTGVEIDPASAECARKKIDQIFCQPIEDLDFLKPGQSFDCIILADVLEHLAEPLSVLRKAASWLKEEGRLLISIPNVNHLSVIIPLILKGEWRYTDSGIMDRTHLRFFTRKSFYRLLAEANLCLESEDTVFSLKGSNWINRLTFGMFKRFLAAQYVFQVRRKKS